MEINFKDTPINPKMSFKKRILDPSLKSPRKAIARLIMGEKLWSKSTLLHSCLHFDGDDSPTKFLMTQRDVTTHEHFATFHILCYFYYFCLFATFATLMIYLLLLLRYYPCCF